MPKGLRRYYATASTFYHAQLLSAIAAAAVGTGEK
jgi:hypothetical protein